MLQSAEVWCGAGDAVVADPGAVAESQAGEAAAVPGHRHQAGITDLREHGQGQALEVWVADHLEATTTRGSVLEPTITAAV